MKVLYTFDNENKTNCLARWPQPLDIRTAYLDETTQIGVIELKTCLQAIVAASPELVAKLGQDYTVYAYDYSEYETPLVGQGMLSWVLASSSSTPSAPAHQSRTIVTGRVCKNLLGIFSSNSQDTLEVKLRLVPVPTSLQSEYIESMKKYRDISQMLPEGFDPQAWTSFVQANPAVLQLASQSRSQSPAVTPGQTGGFGIGHVQRLLSGDGFVQRNKEASCSLPQDNSEQVADAGTQLPRIPSPASSVRSMTAPKRRGRPPGNKSAARSRGTQRRNDTRQTVVETGYAANDDRFEEGPNKKRAKIMQAEWSGKTDFGKQPESLRVAASTAASVRIHQPTAMRPGGSLAHTLEGPPREPTPTADPHNRIQKPQLPVPKSSLRRESFVVEKKSYASPYAPTPAMRNPLESAVTSPEGSRADSSPVDIASSPPVYRGTSTVPSSPNLPNLPRPFTDSGFMSDSIDDLFEDEEVRPLDEEDLQVAAQYSRRSDLAPPREIQEPETQIAHQRFELEQQGPDTRSLTAPEPLARNLAGSRVFSRTASSGSLTPQMPASDPIRPSKLNRSQTWSGNQAPHPASDSAPLPQTMEHPERPMSRGRKGSESGTGSGARRKQAIQSKLASSVAAGEMPPFCDNCGAIETPTWRKAWVKIHSGSPEHVVISEEEGGVIAWQTLQTDPKGNICLYRIVKKSVLKSDVGFTEILLCNRKLPLQLNCLRVLTVLQRVDYGSIHVNVFDQRKFGRSNKKAQMKSGNAVLTAKSRGLT